jgi:hypothetical protein
MFIDSMVAGRFYPADPEILTANIITMLNRAKEFSNLQVPKAMIVPHAGYRYSGPIAASAYACLSKAKIKRVVLLAPAHQYLVDGVATTAAAAYKTPIGAVAIDRQVLDQLRFPFVHVIEEAFKDEHAIEVQLPFLQMVLGDFLLVPFLVGDADEGQLDKLLENLWDGPETLIVISSDLSHYHSYKRAKLLDEKAAEAITALKPDELSYDNACGAVAIKGLLAVAARKKMNVTQLDLRNSGDTSPYTHRLVGYGAFHFI